MGTIHVFINGIFFAAFIASINTTSRYDGEARLTEIAKENPDGRPIEGDSYAGPPKDRSDAYEVSSFKWDKGQTVTWKIIKYSTRKDLSNATVDRAARRAFSSWAAVCTLKFQEIPNSSSSGAQIEIKFIDSIYGGVLGCTYSQYPKKGQTVELNDEINWTVDTYGGINLRQVLTHETGHALGLEHSGDSAAVMFPRHPKNLDPNFDLGDDDIAGIQSLYGAPPGYVKGSSRGSRPANPWGGGGGSPWGGGGGSQWGRGRGSPWGGGGGVGKSSWGRGGTSPWGRGGTSPGGGGGRSQWGRGGTSPWGGGVKPGPNQESSSSSSSSSAEAASSSSFVSSSSSSSSSSAPPSSSSSDDSSSSSGEE